MCIFIWLTKTICTIINWCVKIRWLNKQEEQQQTVWNKNKYDLLLYFWFVRFRSIRLIDTNSCALKLRCCTANSLRLTYIEDNEYTIETKPYLSITQHCIQSIMPSNYSNILVYQIFTFHRIECFLTFTGPFNDWTDSRVKFIQSHVMQSTVWCIWLGSAMSSHPQQPITFKPNTLLLLLYKPQNHWFRYPRNWMGGLSGQRT